MSALHLHTPYGAHTYSGLAATLPNIVILEAVSEGFSDK